MDGQWCNIEILDDLRLEIELCKTTQTKTITIISQVALDKFVIKIFKIYNS